MFNEYDNYDRSEYVVNRYGREICQVVVPAKTTTTPFGTPQTTKISYKSIVSVGSAYIDECRPYTKVIVTSVEIRVPSTNDIVASTKVRVLTGTVRVVTSTTVRVSSTNRSTSHTETLSKHCQVCFAVCVVHYNSCDTHDVEKK